MSTKTIIESRICIEPQYLSKDIMKHILKKISDNTINECTKENGYILKINKIVGITDNYISNSNSEIVFNVKYEVQQLKPEIDKKYSGNVCMLFQSGIFLNIESKIKVLIPIDALKNYEYNQSKLEFKSKNKTIKIGDTVDIIITAINYAKQNFNCIGKLYE
jgi:DNA-directed RNA polymerase subunit E'/Rpb7